MFGGSFNSLGGRSPVLTTCPICATDLAERENLAGSGAPAENLVSICRGCGEILVLAAGASGIAFRGVSASEYLSLSAEAQNLLRVAHELVREQIKRRIC
ncbi:hypothetical protein IMX07_00230 [bacterium]|jgi:hypothetical protein|nr:hypothetical protein [bacterium]